MLGYIKIGAAVASVSPADCENNAKMITECITKAAANKVKLLVLPELALSGYCCGDLFFQRCLLSACEREMKTIIEQTADLNIVSVIGAPVMVNNGIYNCAVVICGGKILGIVPKSFLAQHAEFNEARWFKSGLNAVRTEVISYCGEKSSVPFGSLIFNCENYDGFSFAAEICADLLAVTPPCGYYSLAGAKIVVNLSASPSYALKFHKRREVVKSQSHKCVCAYAYTSSPYSESSADVVFDGHAMIAEQGTMLAESKRYSLENEVITAEIDLESIASERAKTSAFAGFTDSMQHITNVNFTLPAGDTDMPSVTPSKYPYFPQSTNDYAAFYDDIFEIQTCGLCKRLMHTGIKKSVIGVSGGLDSTLALLVAVSCHDKMKLPRENVIGITMPGFGTSGKTRGNAWELMERLGVTRREITINDAVKQHFSDIGHDPANKNAVYENAQARERTQVLMDVANMENGLVIGTGGMSELALGWATYNGDHMSMYGVNAGVPKTVIRGLLSRLCDNNVLFGVGVTEILRDVLDTPVSPELLPADESGQISQKTEDLVGPYELHDYFLYMTVHKGFSPEKTAWLASRSFGGIYNEETITKYLTLFYKRFFSQQFKRSCAPDSPNTLEFGVSQRSGLKIPSDISGGEWLKSLEELKNV